MDPVLLQRSVLHAGKLSRSSPDLHPCFCSTSLSSPHHFSSPTQPRPSPRKRRVVTALHFLCPFLDLRQSLLSIFTAQSLSSTVCSQKPDHYLPYPFVFSAGRTLRVSHVATPTASGPQLLCPRPLSFNSMQKHWVTAS